MIGFERFPVVRKYLGRTSVLLYDSISNMAKQKWFCLRTLGGHLLQEQSRHMTRRNCLGQDHARERPLKAYGLEVLAGQLITALLSHCPASQFRCCLHILFSLPHSVPVTSGITSSLWWCCTGQCPGGTAAHPALGDGARQWGTEQKVSWAEDQKNHLWNLLF